MYVNGLLIFLSVKVYSSTSRDNLLAAVRDTIQTEVGVIITIPNYTALCELYVQYRASLLFCECGWPIFVTSTLSFL